MNVLVTGASGLLGASLVRFLATAGHRVVTLTRAASATTDLPAVWNPVAGQIDLHRAGRLDAVVHLAGETIVQRWTAGAKARIRDSRVRGTTLLCGALARLSEPPRVLITASATGYYGNRGDEWLDEQSVVGGGFLAEVSRDWEAATVPAAECGIRVVRLRLGLVLSARGGALGRMLPAFRLGIGGRLGDGRHYWSWITLDDVLRTIEHALGDEALNGPVNAVSPNPVTNREFTKILGEVLGRPTIFTVPAVAVRMLFGQMGKEALLASARVRPVQLEQTGFVFNLGELEPALRHLLHR